MTAATLETRKNRTALLAFGGALAMLGLGYAAVPLYELARARAERRFRSASMGPPRATCHGVSGLSR